MQGKNFNEIWDNIIPVKYQAFKFHPLGILLYRTKQKPQPNQQERDQPVIPIVLSLVEKTSTVNKKF